MPNRSMALHLAGSLGAFAAPGRKAAPGLPEDAGAGRDGIRFAAAPSAGQVARIQSKGARGKARYDGANPDVFTVFGVLGTSAVWGAKAIGGDSAVWGSTAGWGDSVVWGCSPGSERISISGEK